MEEDTHPTIHINPDVAIDHDLMARVSTGDHHAFRQLVERHQHAVVGTISKMLGNSSDSEDIAQQVFIRVWKHAKRYKPDNKFTTYLYTITRNLVFNESRRRSRKKTTSTDELGETSHFEIPEDPRRQPDATLLRDELQSAIDMAIASLPEKQRIAVVLRRYENTAYEDIAVVLNTTVPSVKSLLFRARTTLREALEKHLDR